MYFFTADEHYGHFNIIRFTGRPFDSLNEMDQALISNHNTVVSKSDITVHAGDFSWYNSKETDKIIEQLNGNHIFLKGCHDHWMKTSRYVKERTTHEIWKRVPRGEDAPKNSTIIVVCHYPMQTWFASFHGSISLHGHDHGRLAPIKNRLEIGVDANNFTPVSEIEVIQRVYEQNKRLEKSNLT